MKKIGGFLFILGAGSAILYFLKLEFIILAWIDTWGPVVGWIIRAALVVVGGFLWLSGKPTE